MTNTKKIQEKIEREINKEWEKVYKLTEKIGNIRSNDYDVKFGASAGFGFMAWAASMFTLPLVINSGALSMPVIQALYVAVPAAIGIGAQELLTKVLKNKERLRKTTRARKQADKTAEVAKLEILKAKKIARIEALHAAIENVENKEKTISKLPLDAQPDVIAKDIRNKEEINGSISSIANLIEEKTSEIDKTITKLTLKEKFWRIRDKSQKFIDIPLWGVLGMLVGVTVYNLPIIANVVLGNPGLSGSLFELLLPGIITGVATTAYAVKHRIDDKKAFDMVNQSLPEGERLSETVDDSERNRKLENNKVERFDLQLRCQSSELASLVAFLFEEKEIKRAKFGDQEDILFEDFEPIQITKETRQHVLDHPEIYQSCPPRVRKGLFYTDDEYEAYVEEVLKKPLPGEEKGISFVKKNVR